MTAHKFLTAFLLLSSVTTVARAAPVFTVLARFSPSTGGSPKGGLYLDSQGNLYGTNAGSGLNGFNYGTVFKVPKSGGSLQTLAEFDRTNGGRPQSTLVADTSGNLYGTTEIGGESDVGTIFQIPMSGGPLVTLASFDGNSGFQPVAGVVRDASGNLYGTVSLGGSNNLGTVYRLDAGASTITSLASFRGTNGSAASGSLFLDSAGVLYGTTAFSNNGAGTAFKIPAAGGTITTIANFFGLSAGTPRAALIQDATGSFYGTFYTGGAGGNGGVFKIPAGGGSPVNLGTLTSVTGYLPLSTLLMDGAGDLYGTATAGGAFGGGTIFKVSSQSGAVTVIASFNPSTTGGASVAGLIADAEGNLYGTTTRDAVNGYGTVFKLSGSGFVPVPEPTNVSLFAPALFFLRRPRRTASVRV